MNAILILSLLAIFICGQEVLATKKKDGKKKSVLRTWKGDHVKIEDVPFVVSLEITKNDSSSFCTGTIVREDWIMTSATCFEHAPSKLKVIYGVDDRGAPDAPAIQIDLPENVTELAQIIHMHPYFMDFLDFHRYDVALIKIEQKIPLGDKVKAAVFEQDEWPIHEGKQEPEERDCSVVGFGQNIHSDTKLHGSIFDFQFGRTCECFYSNPYGLCTRITQGSDFDSACFDDWGAPMICDEKLVGIFSNLGRCSNDTKKIECSDEKLVGGYTYIKPYLPWMQQITQLTLAPLKDTSEEQKKRIEQEQKKMHRLKILLESEFASREQSMKKKWMAEYLQRHPDKHANHEENEAAWKEEWTKRKEEMLQEKIQQVKREEWQKAEQETRKKIEAEKAKWQREQYEKGLHTGMDARKTQHFRAGRSSKFGPSLFFVLMITVISFNV